MTGPRRPRRATRALQRRASLPLPRFRAAILACAAILAGCGDTGPRPGGTAVIAAPGDLDAANPLVSVDAWTNEVLRYVLFTPLIRYDQELDYRPALARSWELVGDTGVIMHLRDDVRWHDGALTTAHDVRFTFERARDPATGFANAHYFERWTGAEVLDSFTIRFSFEPHAEPLAGWPFTPVVPRHLLDTIPAAAMRRAAFNHAPVGNGPFRFQDRRADDRWVFAAVDEYPEQLGGRPLLDRLVWRVVPESAAQLTEVRAGEADLALAPTPAEVRAVLDREDGDVRAVLKPSRQFTFLAWNGRRPPLDDPRVRRALAMGIDRARILNGLVRGFGELGTGPIMPFHWAYDHGLDPLPHDTAAARALLAEAGIRDRDDDGVLDGPDGEPVAIQIKVPAANTVYRDIAEAIRSDLVALGMTVTTRSTEVGTLFADLTGRERDFDATLLGWSGNFRLDLHDTFHSDALAGPYQFAAYTDPVVDSLMNRAELESDRAGARPLWQEIQRRLIEDQPWTVLFYRTDAFVARDRLQGLHMDIRGGLVNVADWWIDEDDRAADDTGG